MKIVNCLINVEGRQVCILYKNHNGFYNYEEWRIVEQEAEWKTSEEKISVEKS
jgi:hypothetical protein